MEIDRIRCGSAEVVNFTVIGGGHTSPGGAQHLSKSVVGTVNRDFSASAAIVDLFHSH